MSSTDNQFSHLTTEQFRCKLRPYVVNVYRDLFKACTVQDLKRTNGNPHILDRMFGIDTVITLSSGATMTVQEKCRENLALTARHLRVESYCPDFTQEYRNAAGTPHESDGEWFHLAAQLYFYGWATAQADGLAAWVLLDVLRYKLIVERAGGLGALGIKRNNTAHGRATFYAIPVERLRPAFLASHNLPEPTVEDVFADD